MGRQSGFSCLKISREKKQLRQAYQGDIQYNASHIHLYYLGQSPESARPGTNHQQSTSLKAKMENYCQICLGHPEPLKNTLLTVCSSKACCHFLRCRFPSLCVCSFPRLKYFGVLLRCAWVPLKSLLRYLSLNRSFLGTNLVSLSVSCGKAIKKHAATTAVLLIWKNSTFKRCFHSAQPLHITTHIQPEEIKYSLSFKTNYHNKPFTCYLIWLIFGSKSIQVSVSSVLNYSHITLITAVFQLSVPVKMP